MFHFRILHSKDRYSQDTYPSPPKKKQCWRVTGTFLVQTKQHWLGRGWGRGHHDAKFTGCDPRVWQDIKFLTLFVQDCSQANFNSRWKLKISHFLVISFSFPNIHNHDHHHGHLHHHLFFFTGKYFYIEASNHAFRDNAKLTFAVPRFKASCCLKFFYHMYGSDMGTLNVFSGNNTIFTKSGNQGNYWKRVTQTVYLSDMVNGYINWTCWNK